MYAHESVRSEGTTRAVQAAPGKVAPTGDRDSAPRPASGPAAGCLFCRYRSPRPGKEKMHD